MSQTELKSPCRFCGVTITIPLPSDERMRQMLRTISTRACCNRCADYKRAVRDNADQLQLTALLLVNSPNDKEVRGSVEKIVSMTCQRIVDLGEKYYDISGIMRDVGDFVTNVMNDPRAARISVDYFDKHMSEIAVSTHCGKGLKYAF